METSAKANINIEKAFCELAEAILDQTTGKDNTTDNQDRPVNVGKDPAKSPGYKGCCA